MSLKVKDEIGATGVSKRCPSCGQDAGADDVLCTNCGYDFRTGTQIGNAARHILMMRAILWGLGVVIAAALVYSFWPRKAPSTAASPPAAEEAAPGEESDAPPAEEPSTAEAGPETDPPDVPEVPPVTDEASLEPEQPAQDTVLSGALDKAKELAEQVGESTAATVADVKDHFAESIKSDDEKRADLTVQMTAELDAKYPLAKPGEQVELRGLNGQIIKGKVMWMRDTTIVLLNGEEKLDISLKALDRRSRVRCDKVFRKKFVQARVEKHLQAQEAK